MCISAQVFLLVGVIFLLAGCPKPIDNVPVQDALSRSEALELYNANVKAIPAFSATIHKWKARFTDSDGDKKNFDELGGKLYYHPIANQNLPPKLYLKTSVLGRGALIIGSNQQEYWMYSEWAERGGWGKYEHLGKPCAENIPIHPLTLLEFIGLMPLDESSPNIIYENRPDTYVITIVDPDSEFMNRREIIFDRRSGLPSRIIAYDKTNQPTISSELKNYKQLANAVIPGDIILAWPERDAFFQLNLVSLKPDFKNGKVADRSRLFRRPHPKNDNQQFIQIDEQCEK
ncbi:MAG: hypothetical protein JXD22_07590 [Sedimentisphaerales bacterium]|nr:hypothetical protein [Sedimentisphaerales bacterium]